MLYNTLNGMRIQLVDAKDSEKGKVYLMDKGKARHIANTESYNRFFSTWDGIWNIRTPYDLEFGGPSDDIDSSTMDIYTYNNEYYLFDIQEAAPSRYRHIADEKTMDFYKFSRDVRYPPDDPTKVRGPEIRWRPNTEGCHVKVTGQPPVYLIENGQKRHILDWDIYRAMFGHSGLPEIDSLDDVPSGYDIASGTRLIKGDQSDVVYLYEDGAKREICSPEVLQFYGFDKAEIVVLSQFEVDRMRLGVIFLLC